MSKLYVVYVLGRNDFNENWKLGIYSSKELAIDAMEKDFISNKMDHDVYMMREFVLNQKILCDFDDTTECDFYHLRKGKLILCTKSIKLDE